jgi:hypothetical protein
MNLEKMLVKYKKLCQHCDVHDTTCEIGIGLEALNFFVTTEPQEDVTDVLQQMELATKQLQDWSDYPTGSGEKLKKSSKYYTYG